MFLLLFFSILLFKKKKKKKRKKKKLRFLAFRPETKSWTNTTLNEEGLSSSSSSSSSCSFRSSPGWRFGSCKTSLKFSEGQTGFKESWISVHVYTPCPTKAGANPPNLHNAQGPVYMGYTHRGPLPRLPMRFRPDSAAHSLFLSLKGKVNQLWHNVKRKPEHRQHRRDLFSKRGTTSIFHLLPVFTCLIQRSGRKKGFPG